MADDKKPSGSSDATRIMDGEARLIARESGLTLEGEPDTLGVCRSMSAEIARLKPFEALAHDGRVLRDALVEDALAEGVRAFGNDFNREAKKTMLEGSGVEMIRELRDSWKGIGDSKLSGGRRSVEDPDNPDGKRRVKATTTKSRRLRKATSRQATPPTRTKCRYPTNL